MNAGAGTAERPTDAGEGPTPTESGPVAEAELAENLSPAETVTELGDQARVEQAREALHSADDVEVWSTRFALLGDVNRLKIMLALHRAPGITVGDLAAAVGMSDNATSHALAALRVTGVVAVDRDGRYRRWSVTDANIHAILHAVGASHSALHPRH